MREVIQQVLATEQEATRMVEASRTQAGLLLTNAQRQGQELIARLRRQAEEEAAAIIQAAVQAALKEKSERLARTMREIEAEIQIDEGVRAQVIDALVRSISGQAQAAAG